MASFANPMWSDTKNGGGPPRFVISTDEVLSVQSSGLTSDEVVEPSSQTQSHPSNNLSSGEQLMTVVKVKACLAARIGGGVVRAGEGLLAVGESVGLCCVKRELHR